ncbi:malonyl-ACP O-methyltransferase BioC [bacterium]|nr:malonyl-ACP O-methyltransferase BioC [bacterium]
MLDKQKIQKNFQKSLETYEENALVQNSMAKKICQLIPSKKFNKILEIGSYTGLLTKKIVAKTEFEDYLAIDIIDSSCYATKISPKIRFQKADIEFFTTQDKFDLIVSNASLQWCESFEKVIKKIISFLAPSGVFVFSVFGERNFIEIKDVFNLQLNYPSPENILKINNNIQIKEEIMKLKFENPLELMRHIKLTGVNSLSSKRITKKQLQMLQEKHNCSLTYHPMYVVIKK